MPEKVKHINVQQRASLFLEALGEVPERTYIRCTGVDDPSLCSSPKARDLKCVNCGAVNLLEYRGVFLSVRDGSIAK